MYSIISASDSCVINTELTARWHYEVLSGLHCVGTCSGEDDVGVHLSEAYSMSVISLPEPSFIVLSAVQHFWMSWCILPPVEHK